MCITVWGLVKRRPERLCTTPTRGAALIRRAAGPKVRVLVDGQPLGAHEGEMLAAALLAAGVVRLRSSPLDHAPRGAFCLMGVCQECLVRIDGVTRQACLGVCHGWVSRLSPYLGCDAMSSRF